MDPGWSYLLGQEWLPDRWLPKCLQQSQLLQELAACQNQEQLIIRLTAERNNADFLVQSSIKSCITGNR